MFPSILAARVHDSVEHEGPRQAAGLFSLIYNNLGGFSSAQDSSLTVPRTSE